MSEADVLSLSRETLWVIVKIAGPLMVAGLIVGLAVSLLQALTQINEASLVFVPKILAIGAVAVLLAPFMGASLGEFSREVFDRIVAIGGGGG